MASTGGAAGRDIFFPKHLMSRSNLRKLVNFIDVPKSVYFRKYLKFHQYVYQFFSKIEIGTQGNRFV